jgi:hypothetical protein
MKRKYITMQMRRQALEACRDKQGRITPQAVWRAARDPKHILHREFPWDVRKAAEICWNEIAQRLIRECKITVTISEIRKILPCYVSDPRTNESSYIATTLVARREELAEAVLLDEVSRIEGAVNRARDLAAAFNLVSEFERLLEDVVLIKEKIERRDRHEARIAPS